MVTKTKYSTNYTFSETFKDASEYSSDFHALSAKELSEMKIRANPPSPPLPSPPLPSPPTSDAGNKTQGIHKVKQYETANFSEVAALPAQEMLHKEILMCDSNAIISWNCMGSELKNCKFSRLLV